MMKYILRLTGFIEYLSGKPSQLGPVARLCQFILKIVLITCFALVLAWVMTWAARDQIDEAEVADAIKAMIAVDFENSAYAKVSEELGGKLSMEFHESDTAIGYSILVGVGEKPNPPTRDPCDPTFASPPAGAICLFSVREIFPNISMLSDFVEISFPGTAYTIPHIAIDAALLAKPESNFTRTRSESTRKAIETLIDERIFLPSNSAVLVGRRVNGKIQYITYILTAIALVLILIAWLSSVVQNAAVSLMGTITLDPSWKGSDRGKISSPGNDEEDADTPPLQEQPPAGIDSSNNSPGDSNDNDEDNSKKSSEGSNDNGPTLNVLVAEEYATPWSDGFVNEGVLDLSDPHMTARFHEAVSRKIQADSSFLGVNTDPPVLRFRRAATRAVANTDDTSILPSFLDAQKDSILAYFDARLSIVRYLLWVIPTVGFIGTILGVSSALSSTIGLQSARELVAGFSQSAVSASMAMAFDTTLIALVAAVVVMLIFHFVQGAEERMTVLERDRAEADVLELSKTVRKAGGPADLAQQLITLGVNTEYLVQDLRLFQTTGPQLRSVIDALNARVEELDSLTRSGAKKDSKSRWITLVLFGTCLALLAVLGHEGYLGEGIETSMRLTREYLRQLL